MKKFSQFIPERFDQIAQLHGALKSGRITNAGQAFTWVKDNGKAIGSGSFSRAYVGEVGPWLVKLSDGDASYDQFAQLVIKGNLSRHNSLYPRILFNEQLEGTWSISAVERLKPLTWGEYSRRMRPFDSVEPNFVFIEYVGGDAVPTVYKIVDKFCEVFRVSREQLDDFVETLWGTGSIGVPDFATRNMGFRSDGSLCIFDPVS